MRDYTLIQGEALATMDKLIEQGLKVDAVICDPPYGTTACKWDSIIPLPDMWNRLNKLIKSRGAIVLFGSEPFSSQLRVSNIKKYKYEWIWVKEQGTNQFLAKKRPLKQHENISVFYNTLPVYNPQMSKGSFISTIRDKKERIDPINNAKLKPTAYNSNGERYPTSVLRFNRDLTGRLHPTQKPEALMEYLIKTYTDESELVLDFTMGSGTTGVAAVNSGRRFIGIELDKDYFKVAESRIKAKLRAKIGGQQ